jgi:tRNA-specific 2-thiouridylase
MIDGYKRGITPNPDVMCNKEIKFGLFLEKALSLGADYVATGHYVKLQRKNVFSLYEAKDKNKDQSYFLWTLTQNQLKHCLFPIGDYLKAQVREIARKAGLPTAEKKDSQGICFLGKVTLADFLKDYIPAEKGVVLTTAGKRVGEHEGAGFYTIGQRHVGVGGMQKPHYVAEKDLKTNTVVVAEGNDNPALYRREIEITDLNFINPSFSEGKILVRVRYRQPLVSAKLYKLSPTTYNLKFDQPVKFVAPGQSAVLYSENGELLGGSVIV